MFKLISRLFFFCCASSVIAQTVAQDTMSLRKSVGLATTFAQPQESNANSYTVLEPGDSRDAPKARSSEGAARNVSLLAGSQNSILPNPAGEAFGANLFSGTFARQGALQFNSEYAITIGDRIQLRLWGGFSFDSTLVVDPKGNIFVPHVGPVRVLGVRNHQLQNVVESAVRTIFRANVFSYASLAAAHPVRVFVGGYVKRPGLFDGNSMESILSYLDQAGGIDLERGSFIDVQVKRGSETRATVNLYAFILQGQIPLIQLSEGDVIFVSARKSTVKVSGLVANANRFEFSEESRTIADMINLARVKPEATHVRVVRNAGGVINTEYYPLDVAKKIVLGNGDELEFTADKKPGTITVRVEGEHLSAQEYVLPYGTFLNELMERIEYSKRSDVQRPQLFRLSVKARQKQLLAVSLKTLESAVLTARSGTTTEAALRTEEAKLVLQWVDRAKQIEPSGQVLISRASADNGLLLENGDIIKIPAKDGLVLVGGEVLFPNAVAFNSRYGLDDYIGMAGGYTQNADTSRVIVAHRDGSFEEGQRAALTAGDEVLVLPKVDVKSREIAKDVMQMIYQIAIAARVVIGL